MTTPGEIVASKLKQFRAQEGKSQEWLAEQLGVSRATINRWETKGADNATVEDLRKIALILGSDITSIVSTAASQSEEDEKWFQNVEKLITTSTNKIIGTIGQYSELKGILNTVDESNRIGLVNLLSNFAKLDDDNQKLLLKSWKSDLEALSQDEDDQSNQDLG